MVLKDIRFIVLRSCPKHSTGEEELWMLDLGFLLFCTFLISFSLHSFLFKNLQDWTLKEDDPIPAGNQWPSGGGVSNWKVFRVSNGPGACLFIAKARVTSASTASFRDNHNIYDTCRPRLSLTLLCFKGIRSCPGLSATVRVRRWRLPGYHRQKTLRRENVKDPTGTTSSPGGFWRILFFWAKADQTENTKLHSKHWMWCAVLRWLCHAFTRAPWEPYLTIWE